MILLLPLLMLCVHAVPQNAGAQDIDNAWIERMLDSAARDADALLREGWGDRAATALPVSPTKPALLTFVSFSMPDDSLKAILDQTARAGGITVLRGLVDNSFKETALRMGKLSREHGPGLSVDPRLFAEHGVTTVPAFVTVGETVPDKIAGNMSLAAALETIAREGDNRDLAQTLLDTLRRAP
ncbi:MAG: type-F conjugative transfer system pilin assembly protein TrbC [Rhodospirillales bacterium CG15_BIG_FIL_POST_REV_8_21_14_020_66_15]|nr:MAG: type-F conjugative transfer system pilin assembly protein TrbC [Rhodospirillales bacterium CG15_BIG_FIL_POST_REV_8_21_14_020_66_15]